jgi:hypothetical protein
MRVVLARLVAQVDLQLKPGVVIRAVQRGLTAAPSHGVPVQVIAKGSQLSAAQVGEALRNDTTVQSQPVTRCPFARIAASLRVGHDEQP